MHILATHRRDHNLSQRDFAQLVRVDQSVISRIEKGVIRPSLDLALRIDEVTNGAVPVAVWASKGAA